MATITGQRLSELTRMDLGGTGTKFYAVSSNNNSFYISEKDLYQTLYSLHLSGAFQPKNEDWRFLHVTGNETVTGTKTFTQLTKFSSINSSGAWVPLITGSKILLGSAGNISGSNINIAGFSNTTPCIGEAAGKLNIAASNSIGGGVAIGNGAGRYSNANSVVFIGALAGGSSASANSNLSLAMAGTNSICIGDSAGYDATDATDCVFIGYNAGYTATNAPNSIFIGSSAGATTPNASESIFLGNNAGIDRAKTLWIDGASSTDPLIYGEFDNRILWINGALIVTGKMIISGNAPSTPTSPGISGQIAMSGQKLFLCTGVNKWGYINITAW